MKPSELLQFLSSAFSIRMPVLITGAPGVGKSDIVADACKHANMDLLLSHPAVADPTDAKGLPWVVDGSATFLPFGDLQQAIHATKPTVWFLDDLGQASAAVQASYMQLLLARRVGNHVLSDHVTFVAATNRRTDRAGVSGVLEPVKSRFGSIVELTVDGTEWTQWALDHGVPPELIAFLRFKPELLEAFSASADLVNSPTPRTWSNVAKLLQLDLPAPIKHQAIVGSVGEGAAVELSAFMRFYNSLVNIDALLLDPMSCAIPTNPAELYSLASALAHRATVTNFDRIAQFVGRMINNGNAEYGVLIVRDARRKCPAIVETTGFVKLATKELVGVL